MSIQHRLLIPLISLGITGLAASCTSPKTEPADYDVTAEGVGNEIIASSGEESVLFEFFSQKGIGSAAVELTSGHFPAQVGLLFHLRGLEQLRVTYNSTEITLSVSSSDNSVRQYVIDDATGSLDPIGPDSPHWMQVEISSPDGSVDGGPGEERLIHVSLLDDFLGGDYQAFQFDWIDFFR